MKWLSNPGGFTNLQLLEYCCAGYRVEQQDGRRWIVAHQEHRMVLPAAWAAHRDRVFSDAPLLLRFDAHDDFAEEGIDYATLVPQIRNLEDCLLFSNSLRNDDGGWVEAAVRAGWVSDVLSLGIDWRWEPPRVVDDLTGKAHRVVSGRWDATAHHPAELGSLLDDAAEAVFVSSIDDALPIWVDVDIDLCVSSGPQSRTRVRGVGEFGRWLETPLSAYGSRSRGTVGDLLDSALECAQLVTIAIEPAYCGGHAGVAQAIEVWEGVLREPGVLRAARMESP